MAATTPGTWSYDPGRQLVRSDAPDADGHAPALVCWPAITDLLEACEEALRVLSAVQGMIIIKRDPGSQKCIESLEAALAKAKGETP